LKLYLAAIFGSPRGHGESSGPFNVLAATAPLSNVRSPNWGKHRFASSGGSPKVSRALGAGMLMSRLKMRGKIPAGRIFALGEPLVRDRSSRIWWVLLLRAAAAVTFGVLTLVWPRHTALALVWLFGGYATFDGLVSLAISARDGFRSRWALTLGGAASIAAGVFAFAQPRRFALVIIAILGCWLILHGMIELGELSGAMATPDRPDRTRRGSAFVNGAMSVLFGASLIAAPRLGALSLTWAMAAWAIMHGLLMIPNALALRRRPR
jgi:uncharacterized membrane protein HdeD (DUF308 family)